MRCKSSVEISQSALVGNYQPEHIFALSQSVALYDFYQAQIDECDKQIEQALAVLHAEKSGPDKSSDKTTNWLTAHLRLAAVTVGKTNAALGAFYRRLAARIGKANTVKATARKIVVLFYNAMRF